MGARATPPPGLSREEVQALAGLTSLLVITTAWWALALWPVPSNPEWLMRTRAVCFGVGGNGLPDFGGWVGLIGGPLGMLTILLVGWSRGVRGVLQRARRSGAMAGTLATLVMGTILLFTGAGLRVQQAMAAADRGDEMLLLEDFDPAAYPRLDRATQPLALTAHTGQRIDLADLAGRPVLVTFAYAHCATICPLLVQNALRTQETLAGTEVAPAIVVVTLDPWRDTPSRLPGMARDWGLPTADAWILGGSVAEVEAALDAWDVPRTRDPSTGAVTHPSLTYIIDSDGRVAYITTGRTETMVALLREL